MNDSGNSGVPKSSSKKKGSTISSTILNLVPTFISLERGFNVLNNISCLIGFLFNKTLTQGINWSNPKLSENSLKYTDDSISAIKVLTAGSKNSLVILGAIDLISFLLLDISFTWKE